MINVLGMREISLSFEGTTIVHIKRVAGLKPLPLIFNRCVK